jgi:PAS domain S-box-containing protein
MTRTPSSNQRRLVLVAPGKIILCYTLFGLAWVFFSDRLAAFLFKNSPEILLQVSTFKGFVFVGVTTLLLVFLLSGHRTAYRRKERELLESQERYQLVVESAPDAILIHDGDRCFYANAAAAQLFGAPSPEALEGLPVMRLVHEDSREAVRERMCRNLVATIPVGLCVQHYLRLDGTSLEVEVAAVPFPLGDRTGALAFIRDIRERQAAQRSLRESESKYRLLADNAHDLIYTLDPDLRLTYVSPSVERLRGLTVDAAMAESIQESMTPASYEKVLAALANHSPASRLDSTTVERMELELLRQGGDTIWVETVVRAMLDPSGGFQGFVGVCRDISERRAAEEERNRSERFLSRILATIPDPVFVKNAEHRFVLVNEALCALVGRSRQEVIGKLDADLLNMDEAKVFLAGDDQVLSTGEENLAEECLTDVHGHTRVIVTKKGLFVDSRGERFIVGVIRDVSEEKRKEARLRDSLQEKEVLLKEVHHRVKNNLQIISSLLFLQQEGIEDPAIQGMFEESRHRIASMALVHEELYRSGDLGRVDVKEYLERLAPKVVASLRGQKRLELALELSPCRLPLDKVIPFGLIVNELLTNAVKHGFVDREAGLIRVAVDMEDALVRLAVEDDGVGLPVGFHPDAVRSLGMQLVVQLTRQLRGALTFGSGATTVFRISFPQADPTA